MKRVLAAFAAIALATAVMAEARAADNIKFSAQPLNTSVNNGTLTVDLMANETLMGAEITGLTASGATLTIEGSTDGRKNSDPAKVWFATVGIPFTCPSPATFSTVSADGPFKLDISGLTNLRFRVSGVGTGTALISVNGIPASTLGSCGGTGGGAGGGNVNIHDAAGNNLTSTGGALNVAGTFSATLGGFTPSAAGARMTPITVQLTDTSQTLPTGAVTIVDNTDTTNPIFCNVNGVAATAADKKIPSNSWFAFTIPGGITTLHCIATGAPVVANGVGGAGLPTGAGGGGGSGSGTFTWPGTAGNATGGTTTAGTMPYVNAYQVNALPAGSASIGSVGLNAGSNSIGTVGLNAGVASIGTVGLNAGSNAIGSITNTQFGISGTLPAFAATPTVNLGTIGTASTAALQSNVQSAPGTPQTVALTVQGNASGVAIPVSISGSGATPNFTPDNSYSTPLAVTSTTGSAALPASATTGSVVILYNRGPNSLFWQAGNAGVTASTSNSPLPPNSSMAFVVKAGQTNVAAVTSVTGLTATMNMESGTGLPQATGGPLNASVFGAAGLVGTSYTNIGATDNAAHTTVIESTAIGTAATVSALGVQGVGTTGAPLNIDTATGGNNLYAAITSPIPAQASHGINIGGVEGLAAAGAPIAGNPLLMGGSDGTLARSLLTSTTGHLVVDCGSAGGSCSGSGGTASSFGSPFPATGTAIGLTNGTNMVAWSATSNYGSAPSAIPVPALNAAVTNTVLVNPGTAASWGILSQNQTTSGQLGALTMAAVTTAAPAYTTAQTSNLSMGLDGGLRVSPSTYPTGAVPITASATGTTAATAATLTNVASHTTYICGFSIRANATAAATADSTVAGTISGTMHYTQWTAPAASGIGVTEQIFPNCIPASAASTSIVVTSAAPGAGGVISVTAWGFSL